MSKIPRGYTVEPKETVLRTKEGPVPTTVYVVTHKKKNFSKTFVSEEAIVTYFQRLEMAKAEKAALAGAGAPSSVKTAVMSVSRELAAFKELAGEFDDVEEDEL